MTSSAKKHFETGLKHFKGGRLQEAEASFAEAIALDEANVDYWLNLGHVWARQNRHDEAGDAYQMAATLNPKSGDALLGLGLSHIRRGEAEKGIAWIEAAFTANPTRKMAEDLGDTFSQHNNWKIAAYYYLKARQFDPKDPNLHAKLASSLYRDGDTNGAMAIYADLVLRYPANISYISSLAELYRKVDHTIFDERAHKAILICLKTENVKYRYFGPAWSSLVLHNPALKELRDLGHPASPGLSSPSLAPLLSDEFVNLGLKNLPILNIEVERIFQGIRRHFLLNRNEAATWPEQALTFLTSLGVQGWYNDFVFYEDQEEIAALQELESEVRTLLKVEELQGPTEALKFALLGCYRPLYVYKQPGQKLPFTKNMLYEMRPLIKAQIQNVETERLLAETIPSFTEITDDVSQAVQQMYAQRPYPRWKSTSMDPIRSDIAEVSRNLTILVAGCGTGQEPAIYAHSTPLARVTAIDLSRPSIAYGKRMAEEIGYAPRIEFLHGDLMEVGKIGKSFDYVVSSGVLHHMKDPERGWQAILDTLKPEGRMTISLYSKIARDHNLGPASHYIREKGYTSSDGDIRRFRQDVFSLPADHPVRGCTRASDFYMLSECNDLLFHVQEHRYTWLDLKEMTSRLGLELIHVYMPPKSLNLWKEKYPDSAGFDFDRLHEFETEYPDTFLEMYKMYYRRKGQTHPHPLDPLIKINLV